MSNNNIDKLESAHAAKDEAKIAMSAHENVCGVGLRRTAAGYKIRLYIAEPSDQDSDLPREIDGFEVETKYVGRVDKSINRISRKNQTKDLEK